MRNFGIGGGMQRCAPRHLLCEQHIVTQLAQHLLALQAAEERARAEASVPPETSQVRHHVRMA